MRRLGLVAIIALSACAPQNTITELDMAAVVKPILAVERPDMATDAIALCVVQNAEPRTELIPIAAATFDGPVPETTTAILSSADRLDVDDCLANPEPARS